jgi:hypothetical protein
VRALAERLGDERTRLDELELAELAVRSCIQVSYQALKGSDDDRERTAARMFRLLGLHPGSEVGTWTAAALLDAPPTAATAALERLVDAQLLESPAPSRYRLHDLLLLFAREQTSKEEPDEERDAALRRMLDCYLATALRANHLLQPGGARGQRPARRGTRGSAGRPRRSLRLVRAGARQPSRRRSPSGRRLGIDASLQRAAQRGDVLVLRDAHLLARLRGDQPARRQRGEAATGPPWRGRRPHQPGYLPDRPAPLGGCDPLLRAGQRDLP